MKKQGSKKTIAVMTAAIICLSMASAMAKETEVTKSIGGEAVVSPRYVAMLDMYSDLYIEDGIAYCEGSTTVSSGYKAGITVELQQNTGSWTTIKTWNATGGTTADVYKEQAVSSGQYRLKVTHKAYNSSGTLIESVVSYS